MVAPEETATDKVEELQLLFCKSCIHKAFSLPPPFPSVASVEKPNPPVPPWGPIVWTPSPKLFKSINVGMELEPVFSAFDAFSIFCCFCKLAYSAV